MRLGLVMATVLLLAGLAGAQATPSTGVGMAQRLNYPHAGVSLAMPAGFELQASVQPTDVVVAVMQGQGEPLMAATLTVLPVPDPQINLGDMVAQVLKQQSASLAVRQLKVLKETPMPVAGLKGEARLLSYTFRGAQRFSARVFFVRDLATAPQRLCYILTVEAAAHVRQQLLPMLGEIIKGLELTPLAPPGQAPVEGPFTRIADGSNLLAVGVPRGWFVQASGGGLSLGQVNYLAGGEMGRQVMVMLRPGREGSGPQQAVERDLQSAQNVATQRKFQTRVVSDGPASFAGRSGWGFVIEQYPGPQTSAPALPPSVASSSAPASGPSQPADQRIVIAQRTTQVVGPSGPLLLSAMMVAGSAAPQQVANDLDEFMAHMEMPEPATQPAPAAAAPAPAP